MPRDHARFFLFPNTKAKKSGQEERKQNLDTTGDPWNGRTLEWATHSPPPFYNFATLPEITSYEVFWDMKKNGLKLDTKYEDIECFKNTGMGIYISVFAFIAGFAIVWHIHWLALVGLIGATFCIILLSFDDELEYVLPAREVAKIEQSYRDR